MPLRRFAQLVVTLLCGAIFSGCAPASPGGMPLDCPTDVTAEARAFEGGILYACVDESGIDHGPQLAISNAGYVLFEGRFVGGEPDGVSRVARSSDQACCAWDYAFDHGRPLWRRGWGADGRLFAEWVYDASGRADVRRWHTNGVQSDAFEVVDGNVDGRWLRWWPSGRLQQDSGWRVGELEGPFREWYADGTPRLDGGFRNGQRTGEWSVWSETGELKNRRHSSGGVPAAPR